MVEPWFNPSYGWVPAVTLGLIGAMTSKVAGKLAPLGKARRAVTGGLFAQLGISALFLIAALVARLSGQPFGIWFMGLALTGMVNSTVMTVITLRVLRVYRRSNEQQVTAQGRV